MTPWVCGLFKEIREWNPFPPVVLGEPEILWSGPKSYDELVSCYIEMIESAKRNEPQPIPVNQHDWEQLVKNLR